MALMPSQLQEDGVKFRFCERCGKVTLIYERCDCYNETSKPSNRDKQVTKTTRI